MWNLMTPIPVRPVRFYEYFSVLSHWNSWEFFPYLYLRIILCISNWWFQYMEVLFASLAYLSPVICCNLYSKKYVKSAADIFCIIWNQFHMVQPHQSTFILVFSKCFLPLPFISQKRKTSDKYVRKCLNLTQIWYYSQSIDCGCGVVQDLYPESNHPKRKPPVMYMFKMYYINMIFSEKYFCCLFSRAIPGQMTS